ncbi:hypothetical protein [Candidatus Poriferisodalis sp.]|uniref:hypothetical protein n=1 Tax=Candidatus Poriferisodalis sp. TaxID=3101277 RepID=UPI003AF65C77
MSEQERSRLYAWFCDHADEPLAEYVMSCLAPAPLADIATKADVRDLAAKIGALVAQREADRKETAAQRDTDRKETAALIGALAAQREADRKDAAEQREADLRTSRHRHYWAVGIMTTLFGANMTVVLGSLLNAL